MSPLILHVLLLTVIGGAYAFAPAHSIHRKDGLLSIANPLARISPKGFSINNSERVVSQQHLQRLSMSINGDDDKQKEDESNSFSPQAAVKKAADDFFSSSVYRTLLFTTPFLFNPKFRANVPTPAIVLTVTAILMYNTYDMRNSDIKDLFIPKRNAALRVLKGARADRLSNSEIDVEAAQEDYEEALREECKQRVIVPALWVIPFPDDENRKAANTFLDLEITDKCELIPLSDAKSADE
jgi:hypothetical protein